jgi:hypothetical protein
MTAFVHATARLCQGPVAQVMAHLTTAEGMARWNLGLSSCRELEPGLFTGASLFDGAQGWVRIVAVPGLDAVDYHVGASPERLVPRIHARVVDGAPLGHDAGTCVVTLLAWRDGGMTDERWRRLVCTHETEIELIQAQLKAKDRQ